MFDIPEATVELTGVQGKPTVVCGDDLPGSIQDYSDGGQYRFYFLEVGGPSHLIIILSRHVVPDLLVLKHTIGIGSHSPH